MATWRNWAGNQRCVPHELRAPRSHDEVAEIVASTAAQGRRVRVVGSGHSFTPLVCTDGVLLDLEHLRGVVLVDDDGTATIRAGTPLHEVSAALARRGRAFENLGDIAVQTIAGATATATHGTGARFGNLSSTVVGARLVSGDGSTIDVDADRDADVLRAVRVNLGALGVLTELRIRTVPAFTLHAEEAVEPVDEVLADLDAFVDGHDHAEFFWFPGSDHALTKRNRRSDEPAQPRNRVAAWIGDELVNNTAYNALIRVSDHVPGAVRVIHQVLRRRPDSTYSDRSDRVFASARRMRFVEMEQSVPREAFPEAFARLRDLLAADGRAMPFPIECRWVAGDDAWLSPANGGDRAYLAVHLTPRRADEALFRRIEEAFADLGARPHWGKLHHLEAATLASRYPRWNDFAAVRADLDPGGTFRNPHLDHVLGPIAAPAGRS